MYLPKSIMTFLVVVVGAFILAAIDSALGLNQTFLDIGSVKTIIHKTAFMAQGGAIVAIVMWKND